ncbi:MAG TPA: hypothetical protein VGG14_01635 [Candidatus Sulfotelmatobacter sp.]|jgi:hypothetical protein
MASELEEIGAVRREIWNLLKLQMETLGSAQALTDRQIIECYNRQIRVLELREKLEMSISEKHPEVALGLCAENTFRTPIPQESVDSLLSAA